MLWPRACSTAKVAPSLLWPGWKCLYNYTSTSSEAGAAEGDPPGSGTDCTFDQLAAGLMDLQSVTHYNLQMLHILCLIWIILGIRTACSIGHASGWRCMSRMADWAGEGTSRLHDESRHGMGNKIKQLKLNAHLGSKLLKQSISRQQGMPVFQNHAWRE